MHSFTAVIVLAAAAGFASAAPSSRRWTDPTVCAPGTGYYQVCGGNGFKGCCTADACGAAWCSDYTPGTYQLKTAAPAPAPVPAPVPVPAGKPATAPVDPTVCAAGTGFFQSCSNDFKGCCKTDACGPTGWCPDYKFGTYEPKTVTPPVTGHEHHGTPAPAPVPVPAGKPATAPVDPTVCAAGTGFFQSCSNGFRGCCKTDACGASAWCPDYKFGTYEPKTIVTPPVTGHEHHGAPAPAPVPVPAGKPATAPADPTVCAAGTGFYQVCASGFKGCCKADACTLGYCPN